MLFMQNTFHLYTIIRSMGMEVASTQNWLKLEGGPSDEEKEYFSFWPWYWPFFIGAVKYITFKMGKTNTFYVSFHEMLILTMARGYGGNLGITNIRFIRKNSQMHNIRKKLLLDWEKQIIPL